MDRNQTHLQERCEDLPMLFDYFVLPMDPWDTFSKNHWLRLFHGRFSVWLQDMLVFFLAVLKRQSNDILQPGKLSVMLKVSNFLR